MLKAALMTLLVAIAACGGGGAKTTTETTTPAKATKILVLVDENGVGLGGNDPVAYAKDNAATPGDAAITSELGGAKYQFSSADNKAAFDAEPAKKAPAFGGYCAFAASQNRLSESDPAVFTIHDGQLLVFTNEDFRAQFLKDPGGNKAKADKNWPGLVEQYGR
jgi:YHS domain-containing protein